MTPKREYEFEFVCESDTEVARVVGFLLGCHQHSFEVVRPDSSTKRVRFSAMASNCLRKNYAYITRIEES